MKAIQDLAAEVRSSRIGDWAEYARYLALNRGSAPNALAMAKSSGASKRVVDALVERASVGAAGVSGGWGTELSALRLLEGAFGDWLQNASAFYQLPIIKVPSANDRWLGFERREVRASRTPARRRRWFVPTSSTQSSRAAKGDSRVVPHDARTFCANRPLLSR